MFSNGRCYLDFVSVAFNASGEAQHVQKLLAVEILVLYFTEQSITEMAKLQLSRSLAAAFLILVFLCNNVV